MERVLHLAAVANMRGKRCKLTDNLVLKNAEFYRLVYCSVARVTIHEH